MEDELDLLLSQLDEDKLTYLLFDGALTQTASTTSDAVPHPLQLPEVSLLQMSSAFL